MVYTLETTFAICIMFFLMFMIQTLASAYFKNYPKLKLLPILMIIMVPLDFVFRVPPASAGIALSSFIESLSFVVPMTVAVLYGRYVGDDLRNEYDRECARSEQSDDEDMMFGDDDL